LSQDDLFVLSVDDLLDMIEGHENDIKNDWIRTRLGGYLSILPHISSKEQKTLTPEKLWPLPWETTNKESEITKDDINHAKALAEIVKSGKIKIRDKNGKS
jgi:hypothetical protein